MNLRQAAEMALECLNYHWDNPDSELEEWPYVLEAKQALRQALAQPKQEPVGYVTDSGKSAYILLGVDLEDDTPLYTAPPKQWVGLTDQEINSVCYRRDWTAPWTDVTFARAIEAKLREKNHG